MLNLLDKKYLKEYDNWLKITTIMKSLNKYELWNDWSKKSKNYNKQNNDKIWNGIKINFDENYLKYLTGYETSFYREYIPLTIKIEKQIINTKYLSDKIINILNRCALFESCTGTGKTTLMAKIIKEIISKDKTKRILCIVSKISLGKQQIKSFKEEGIELKSYTDNNKDIIKDNMVCCINSLMMFENLTKEEMKNTILYLDEVNSLIKDTIDNMTLHSNLRRIYHTLKRLINNCYKIIVTDALITDNVLNLLDKIEDKIFIKNEYKKFEGIHAINVKDENLFLEKLKKHCIEDKYFLFGCDSIDTATRYYNECVKLNNEEKNVEEMLQV